VPPSTKVILDRVRRVPPGYVTTYGDVSPGAPRLAGRALSQLPDGHDVPWWRVVRSDGSMAVGSEQRARLLEEDVPLRPSGRVDLQAARIPQDVIL
jgi:methylated-DNA-protein-cysteine methyltransferase-like protein